MSEEGYNATVTQIGNHGNYMITCNHGNYKAIMLLLWPYGYHMVIMVTMVTIWCIQVHGNHGNNIPNIVTMVNIL